MPGKVRLNGEETAIFAAKKISTVPPRMSEGGYTISFYACEKSYKENQKIT